MRDRIPWPTAALFIAVLSLATGYVAGHGVTVAIRAVLEAVT